MTILVIFLMSLLLIMVKYTVNDRLSKTVIYLYLLWWMVWLVMSTLNLYRLFDVPIRIYMLLIFGLFMFLIGYLIAHNKQREKLVKTFSHQELRIHKNLVFNIVLSVVCVILTYYFIKYMYLRTVLPTDELRMVRFSVGRLFSTTSQLIFFNFFVEAFVFFLYPVIAYLLMRRNYISYTFVVSALSIVMYASIGSGRLPVVYLMITLIISFFMNFSSNDEAPAYHKTIMKASFYGLIILTPVLIVYASYLTAVRLGLSGFSMDALTVGFNELFKQFIIYFTGPFRALNYGIIHYAPEIVPLYGQATLAGFNEIIHATFHVLGIEIQNINYLIGDYLQNRAILVGDDVYMNYSFTYLMIFYFDFGVFGIVFWSMLFGFLTRKIIFMFEDHQTLPSYILFMLFFMAMIISIFNWLIQSPSIVIGIIACLVWHYSMTEKNNLITEETVQPKNTTYVNENFTN